VHSRRNASNSSGPTGLPVIGHSHRITHLLTTFSTRIYENDFHVPLPFPKPSLSSAGQYAWRRRRVHTYHVHRRNSSHTILCQPTRERQVTKVHARPRPE
jgi:hypothetical protein